jgi:hypothetical protein
LIFFCSYIFINRYSYSLWLINYLILFIEMVFKIRDKSLFWTKSGWKNNWEPKILNMPKAINVVNTQYITSRFDHHSFLRSINSLIQSFRPIVISHVVVNSISMATLQPNSFLSSNLEISSNFPSIAILQSNLLRMVLYSDNYLVKKNGRPNR